MDAVLVVVLPVDLLQASDIVHNARGEKSGGKPTAGSEADFGGGKSKKDETESVGGKAKKGESDSGGKSKDSGGKSKDSGGKSKDSGGKSKDSGGKSKVADEAVSGGKNAKKKGEVHSGGEKVAGKRGAGYRHAQGGRLGYFVMKKGETLSDLRKHLLSRAREVNERNMLMMHARSKKHDSVRRHAHDNSSEDGRSGHVESSGDADAYVDNLNYNRDWGGWGPGGEGLNLVHGGFLFVLEEGTRIVDQESESGFGVCDLRGGVACVMDQKVVDYIQVGYVHAYV
jgi:hypothetical protein